MKKGPSNKVYQQGGRGVTMALARLTPQLSTATFNRAALENMGSPDKVIFYDLGQGRAIVQPYFKSTTNELFNMLKKRGALVNARQFSLSVRNGTAVFRTPSWLRELKGVVNSSLPVQGYKVTKLDHCLYFDFKIPAKTEALDLTDLLAFVGAQKLANEALSFDDVFTKRKDKKRVEKKERKPAKKAVAPKTKPVPVAEPPVEEEAPKPKKVKTPKPEAVAPPPPDEEELPSEDEDDDFDLDDDDEVTEDDSSSPAFEDEEEGEETPEVEVHANFGRKNVRPPLRAK